MSRLISCHKCGRIHEENKCTISTSIYGRKNQTRKYRNTVRWNYARKQALERDLYCCRMCLDKDNYIERERLEVHHIIPLYKNHTMAYDIDNLITLCNRHHRLVEDDKRYTKYLQSLVNKPMNFSV